MEWITNTLLTHGRYIKAHIRTHMVCLRAVQKALGVQQDTLAKLANENTHSMRFLLHRAEVEQASLSLGALEDSVVPSAITTSD